MAQEHRKQEQRLSEERFQHDAARRVEAIQEAANDRLGIISVLEAFYAGSQLVERKEFQTFAAPLVKKYQGAQALGWAPLVTAVGRKAHERTVRENGFPNYSITERDDTGRFVPAGERDLYCPILYLEPLDKNKSLLGFDLCTDRACRAAIEKARATGRPAAAGSTVGEDLANDRLLFIVAPARNESADADHPADQPGTNGIVFGIFRIGTIVNSALASFDPIGINVLIRDPADKGDEQPIFYRPSTVPGGEKTMDRPPAPSERSLDAICYRDVVDVADRQGVVECVPSEAYMAKEQGWGPALILLMGTMITALLVGILYLLSVRNIRVGQLVAQRTQELQASEQRFRRLVDNASDAFFLHDINGRILDVSKQACDTLGYTRKELLAMYISNVDVDVPANVCRDLWTLPDNKYPINVEGIHRRKDGTTFPVEVRLVPLGQGDKRLILGLARDITDRKRAEKELHREQRLLRDMLDLQERDRKLTAFEIHDGLAQQLTGALYKFQSFDHLRESDPDAAGKMYDEAVRLLREAMAETRRLIGGLRPPVLDESGIVAAVDDLISEYRQHEGIEIEFVHAVENQRFAPPLESTVFRIVQESLTNACRHSRSDKVRVELGISDGHMLIDVRDWGTGFNSATAPAGHFGLRGIRERARLLGGSAKIESAPEQGTHVHVELPLFFQSENGTTNNHTHP